MTVSLDTVHSGCPNVCLPPIIDPQLTLLFLGSCNQWFGKSGQENENLVLQIVSPVVDLFDEKLSRLVLQYRRSQLARKQTTKKTRYRAGATQSRTRIDGFKVQSANPYNIEPVIQPDEYYIIE